MKFSDKVREYSIECHTSMNQLYDGYLPYQFHLDMVVANTHRFKHLIPKDILPFDDATIFEIIISADYGHDLIEDTRENYNAVYERVKAIIMYSQMQGRDIIYFDRNEAIARSVVDIIYAVTNEKGKNRKERENEKYFSGIKNTACATFVKLCDRIANVEYSKMTAWKDKGKLEMYKKEHANFVDQLYDEKYKEMFVYLEKLFGFVRKGPSLPIRNEPYIDWIIPSKGDAGADGSLRAGYLMGDLIEALDFIEMITRAPIVKESDKELKTQAEKFLTKYLPK